MRGEQRKRSWCGEQEEQSFKKQNAEVNSIREITKYMNSKRPFFKSDDNDDRTGAILEGWWEQEPENGEKIGCV